MLQESVIIDLYLSLQVRKIAAVFRLQPSSLYLAEEFDNIVIFPYEQSGIFNKQQIDSRCSYQVHGDEVVVPTSHGAPFGGYTGPSHQHMIPSTLPPPPSPTFPAAGRKKNTFRKTIVLVSLTSTSADKPFSSKSSGLNYTVVTQVVVTMEANNCSSGAAADLVKQQVGYEVILVSAAMFWILRPVEALSTGSLQEKS